MVERRRIERLRGRGVYRGEKSAEDICGYAGISCELIYYFVLLSPSYGAD